MPHPFLCFFFIYIYKVSLTGYFVGKFNFSGIQLFSFDISCMTTIFVLTKIERVTVRSGGYISTHAGGPGSNPSSGRGGIGDWPSTT